MTLRPRKPDTVTAEAWCQLILRHAGLTFRATQVPAVLGYVHEQMAASGAACERSYYETLANEPDGGPEWTALVEHLLNHETRFFRHPASFDVVRTHILPELRDARGGRLNFWSAGCSTGQEAYSLAMVAMDDEDLDGDFTVWGGDISRQAIDIARRARYGSRAVASVPESYGHRFLRPCHTDGPHEFEITEDVRRHTRFSTTNLVSTSSTVNLTYDLIFCQNVLIYLSPMAVSQVVARLASHLSLGGYLLLGPGEGPTQRPPAVETVTIDGVRVLRRCHHSTAEAHAC